MADLQVFEILLDKRRGARTAAGPQLGGYRFGLIEWANNQLNAKSGAPLKRCP